MISKNIEEIKNKLFQIEFKEKFDLLIFIANWWIIPWMMLHQILKVPYEIIYINYRDENHSPKYDEPVLLKDLNIDVKWKNILLVDDVSKTWLTFKLAKWKLINSEKIKTFVINWKADYSLYNEECFKLPWLI